MSGRRSSTPRWVIAAKVALHVACFAPLAWIVVDIVGGELGPDPVAQLTHRTGIWALRFLALTLAVTPLRRLGGWPALLRFRRMLGLYAFAYACVHLGIYVVLDLGSFWREILDGIRRKPFITAGFLAWLSMLPLALTSTRAAMRRLGPRWQQLHRLVYLSAIAASLHFIWLVKSGERIARLEPLVYAAIFALLLLARVDFAKWWAKLWQKANA